MTDNKLEIHDDGPVFSSTAIRDFIREFLERLQKTSDENRQHFQKEKNNEKCYDNFFSFNN